jgi:hypothetical protein
MANTQINQLPLYTGNTSGTYLVLNNSGETTTYKVTKEHLIGNVNVNTGQTNTIAYFENSGSIKGSPVFKSVNSNNTVAIGTETFNGSQPERLMVDGGNSYNIATFQTSKQDSYAEVNIKNFGSGSHASTDLVLWNDSATESSSYVDLGINSSNYNDPSNVGYGGDGYLISQNNDLYVGSNDYVTNHGHVHLFAGGRSLRPSISVYGDTTIGFNVNVLDFGQQTTIPSSTSGFTYEFSGSMKLNNDLRVEGKTTNTSYVVLSQVSGSLNFTNDADAATGGVPLGGLYRNGNFIMIRMS